MDDAGVDEVPLRLSGFTLPIAAHLLGAAASLTKALAKFGVIHERFDGAEAIGPFGKTLAGQRAVAARVAAATATAAGLSAEGLRELL